MIRGRLPARRPLRTRLAIADLHRCYIFAEKYLMMSGARQHKRRYVAGEEGGTKPEVRAEISSLRQTSRCQADLNERGTVQASYPALNCGLVRSRDKAFVSCAKLECIPTIDPAFCLVLPLYVIPSSRTAHFLVVIPLSALNVRQIRTSVEVS